MKVLARILVPVALVAALGACAPDGSSGSGSDGEEPAADGEASTSAPAEEVTLEQWATGADQVCARAEAAAADADPIVSYLELAGRPVETTEDLLDQLLDEPLPTDDEDRAEAQAWLNALQTLAEQLGAGAELVADGDWAAGIDELDAATPLATHADAAADDLGLEDCASDPSSRDLVLSFSQAFEDGVVEGLSGYPPEQARCIAKAFVAAVRDGSITDPDDPDEAVVEAIFDRCVGQ